MNKWLEGRVCRVVRRRVTAAVFAAVFTVCPAARAQTARTAATIPVSGKADAALVLPARGASIVVKVARYEDARHALLSAANAHGAELVEQQTQVTDKGRKHGALQFRLAADALPGFLSRVRGVGVLSGERLSTVDHGSEAASLSKRVQRLQEHETRLGGILSAPRKLRGSDVLYVQERLFRASVDESLLSQRREDLERDARQCDVVVTLFEPIPVTQTARVQRDVARSFRDGIGYAKASASAFAARVLTLLAYCAVFAPLWGVGLLGLAFAARRLQRWWRGKCAAPMP